MLLYQIYINQNVKTMLCPCCSKKLYKDCCQKYIENKAQPTTAQALMRSRYSAYTFSNIDYIVQTMRGKPLQGFNKKQVKLWSEQVIWLKLDVLTVSEYMIEFKAYFMENNHEDFIYEKSYFKCNSKGWFYIGS